MKERKFLTSTLLIAAAMSLGGVSAWAAGDGSQGNPYTGGISDLDLSENNGWTANDTVYIDGWTSGYWVTGTGDSDNKYITFKANIEIGVNGITLTNAYSETEYTFAGNISGVGDWIFNGPSAASGTPTQRYLFLGDMSGYSGHMSITAASQAKWRGYLHFGDGGQAATDTNISGTGSITTTSSGTNDIDIVFNYGSYANEDSQAITIGNSYISTNSLEFTGTVNYIVSSDLIGTGNSSALKITNTGEDGASATTKITGSISGFSSITVANGSTLELAGDVELNDAISNSGTVVVDSTVRFAIDNLTGTAVENSDGTSYTYTFVAGEGSITGWGDLKYENFTLDGVDIGRSTIVIGEVDGQITITFVAGENLTWNGADDNNVWKNLGTNWKNGTDDGTFYNHDSVTFGAIEDSGISSTVVIAETMSTGSIAVQDSYTFTTDVENGVTVKTSTLTVDEDKVLTVGDGVTIYVETVGSFSVEGAITGTGTLEFDFGTDYTTSIDLGSSKLDSGTDAFSGTIYIHSGNIELDLSDIGNGGYIFADGVNAQVSGKITIPTLTLEGETTLQKANSNNTDTSVSITNLTLENGAVLTFHTTGDNPSSNTQGLYIGELTLTGSWAEIKTNNWQNYINISALIGENATLYLGSTATSSATVVYELGTTTHGEGYESTSQFSGKISLSDVASGSPRSVSLVISEEKIAANAVIELGVESDSSDYLSLGVNAERVEIAGLVSGSNHNGTDIVYSGATSISTTGANITSNSTDTNTLAINVAYGEEYSFSGKFLDKLNLEKLGTGTQSIIFQSGSTFDGAISVVAGTLNLSGVSDSGTAISTSTITVAKDSTLSLSDLTISLSSAIENSGTVTIDESSVTFVLDGLELQYSEDQTHSYYEVISSNSGTLEFADSDVGLSNSNFTLDGSEISSSWNVYVSNDGFVYVYSDVEADLYWAGTSDSYSWTNDTGVKDWTMGEGGTTEAFFSEGASVHFGTITDDSPYATVNVVGTVTASSTTINDSYTFTTSESGAVINTGALTVTADGISFVAENGASLTVNIESLTMSGDAGNSWGANYTMTFSGAVTATIGEYNYEQFHVEDGAVLDLTNANYTASGNGYIYITGEGSTVKISNGKWGSGSNFGASMYNNRIQISNGGILEVTVAQTADGTSGGERGFAVTEGEGTYRFSGTGTSYISSTDRNIHLGNADDNNATLIFDVVNSGATLDVSMVIAYGLSSGDSDVIGSVTTSTGSLVKTGEGTLILEATNLYSGGTKIQQGVLEAANSSALGTGTISIEGGQLSINQSITISNTVNVTFSNAYQVVSDTDTTGFYAIAGTGELTNDTGGVEITLFLDDAMTALLVSEGELYFALMETDVNSEYETDFSISLSEALSSYDYEYYVDTGVVRIFATPEPELFSIFFGLGALGLVATRRRRRQKVA